MPARYAQLDMHKIKQLITIQSSDGSINLNNLVSHGATDTAYISINIINTQVRIKIRQIISHCKLQNSYIKYLGVNTSKC